MIKQRFAYFKLAMLLSLLGLASCVELLAPKVKTELHELRPGSYQIDKSHTRVLFKVNHLGLSTYVGRFNDFDASLNFDPENLSASNLQAVVKTASLDLNDSDLENTLREPSWFNSAQFPEAVFTTLSVEPTNNSELNYRGELTLSGVTKQVSMLVDFHGGANNLLTGAYTLGFSATATIKRSDFGMDKYLGLVGDEVSIEVYAEFQRQ